MLRVDCYDFYKLGAVIRPLTEIPNDGSLSDIWFTLYSAKNELNTFFGTFPLRTSLPLAMALYQEVLKFVPDVFGGLAFNDDDGNPRKLNFVETGRIRDAAKEFETVLKAELVGWDTFFVSQKGAFSTSDLIDRAETMLAESARTFLGHDAREDIRQCGRCLAFNLSTAAAFHIVRATESFIWQYYEALVGHLPPVKMRNWGAYAKNMEKCGNADRKIIGWMNQIRDEYRNPVLHPNEVVSPDDALEFINACLALMASIARALTKIKAAKQIEASSEEATL